MIDSKGENAGVLFARRLIGCGMCGHSFTKEEAAACHKGCPMSKGCGLVTCPSCGYEFPPESKLVNLITNLLRRAKSAPAT